MKRFAVNVEATYREVVVVEAETFEEALSIVNTPGFCYEDALDYEHDLHPEIVGISAEEA